MKPFLYLLTLVLCIQGLTTYAQDVTKVTGVSGSAIITGRISEAEARREALNAAKVEALRQAGVTQHLQSYEMLFRSEMNNDFSEFFSSDIQAELQGAVQEYDIVAWNRKIDPETNLFAVEVILDATVIKYSVRPDPTFTVRVEGIKGIYEEGESLTFSIMATQNCYLNIFGITDHYTSLLYPNAWESHTMIEAGKKVSFPFPMGHIDYELFKSQEEPELTRVVFVFTKDPIQYLNHSGGDEQITTSEDIFSWIYSIMPDQRRMDYQMFTIR